MIETKLRFSEKTKNKTKSKFAVKVNTGQHTEVFKNGIQNSNPAFSYYFHLHICSADSLNISHLIFCLFFPCVFTFFYNF